MDLEIEKLVKDLVCEDDETYLEELYDLPDCSL
jgi:hypothetical protein